MTEEQLGKGGVQSVQDLRDFKYCDTGHASKPFDWDAGFDIETIVGKLPVKDQEITSACGGFAWATYSYVLDTTNREEKSEKFIYAQTAEKGGGSSGRTNCRLCRDKGVSTKALCPLPKPLTEANITARLITDEAYRDALTNRAETYLVETFPSVDTVAQMVRDNQGAVILIRGQNNGTWLSSYPRPPVNATYENTWGHFLYCGKARMENGVKFIGVLNSWGESVGDHGWQWLSEDHFKQRFIFESWAMTELKKIDFTFTKTLRFGSFGLSVKMLQLKLGVGSDGIFGWKTRQAVINFQLSRGLVGDGIVGVLTNNELNK